MIESTTICLAFLFTVAFLFTGAANYQGIPTLNGVFNIQYDSMTIPATGSYFIGNAAINSLVLNQIGTTIYDESNTQANMNFFDGVLTRIQIGGVPRGVGGILSSEDDFTISGLGSNFTPVTISSSLVVSTTQSDDFASGSFSVVPEPSSVCLLGLSCVSLAFRRARG